MYTNSIKVILNRCVVVYLAQISATQKEDHVFRESFFGQSLVRTSCDVSKRIKRRELYSKPNKIHKNGVTKL